MSTPQIKPASQVTDSRFLKTLRREAVDRAPIWLMRQAGRYLPEYRKLRADCTDFVEFCSLPELVCEATLQPIQRFGFDASIIFSDILMLPNALGLGLFFEKNHGPRFHKPLSQQPRSLPDHLSAQELETLQPVYDGIALTRRELPTNVPLIGFAGAPWTVAAYMFEGGPGPVFRTARRAMYENVDYFEQTITKVAQLTAEHLIGQVKAGANAIMIFDSWAGLLTHPQFMRYSIAPIQKILTILKSDSATKNTPTIVFCKGAGSWLNDQQTLACNALGIDWQTSMSAARDQLSQTHAVQGNLDPALLYADHRTIEKSVLEQRDIWQDQPGHILNLGHGIYLDTPVEAVEALVAAARS